MLVYGKDRLINGILGAALGLVAVLMIYPFLYILFASVSDPLSVVRSPLLLYPKKPTLQAFRYLFSVNLVWIGYGNTLLYAVAGTALNLVMTMLGGYCLAHPDFRGKRIILFLLVITMYFSGGMIPLFLVVKSLGLLDRRLAVILPVAVSTWNLFITRSYLEANIPGELRDAAEVDGASELTVFLRIVLPLSQSIVAVLILFYATGHWNSFFNALLFLRNRNLYPLQVYLRELLLMETQMDAMLDDAFADRAYLMLTLKYSIMVVAVLPLLVAFPFVQRYFVKGVMIGALKG
jgi:putative aldouronate transport system permease protein